MSHFAKRMKYIDRRQCRASLAGDFCLSDSNISRSRNGFAERPCWARFSVGDFDVAENN